MTKITFLLFTILSSTFVFSQTTLSAGDVAVIGMKGDAPDSFSFILFKDIQSGTVINFTEDSWLPEAKKFRGGSEGTYTFTATSDYPAGKVITLNSGITNLEFGNTQLSSGISASGDQILVYQGGKTNPNFIFAINVASKLFATTDIDADDPNRTGLPLGLTNGLNAIAVGAGIGHEDEYDNAYYLGATIGSIDTVKKEIVDSSNWYGVNEPQGYDTSVITSDFTLSTLHNNYNPIVGLEVYSNYGKFNSNKGEISVVYDVLGQVVNNYNLKKGIYFVKIEESDKSVVLKLGI